jgi:peptidoglycan/LPS O-acetylase OafA/YrhL
MVLAAHFCLRTAPQMDPKVNSYVTLLAFSGVKVFFVLSGFLITSLLLKEFGKTGTISLRSFYWRRTLRIFPAMYVLLIALGIGYAAGIIPIHQDSPFKILAAAAYISDYIQVWGWPLHHTWSLSVEEQFYFLWPAALLFCGLRRAALFPVALIFGALMSRAVSYSEFRFDSVADSLAVGCLVSIYRTRLESVLRRIWPPGVPLAFLMFLPVVLLPAANPYLGHRLISSVVGIPLLNAGIGIAMLAVIQQPPAWLNVAPIVGLGRLSYSLYLWQQPWIFDLRTGWLWLPGALLCAWLSYRFVEVPVLQWRDRARSRVIEPAFAEKN